MTDREAMLILAEPIPEPFRQVRPTAADDARRDAYTKRYLAAMRHARRSRDGAR